MIQTCFVCTGEIQLNDLINSEENSILLCQILEMTHVQNNENKLSELNYCPGCLSRMLNIRDMLEDLEKLEKRILDEKYLIENQLKENSRNKVDAKGTEKNNSANELRIKVGTELTAKTIQSMLKKIRKKRVGRKLGPQRPVRIMKNVTIPKLSTLQDRRYYQNSGDHVQIQNLSSPKESGSFMCHESPINYHGSFLLENNLEVQPSSGDGALEDPLQVSTGRTSWTASDVDIDIKYERNSYLLDVCNDIHVDDLMAASEFTSSTSTEIVSNSVKSEVGERFGVTEFTNVQGTDDCSGNTKTYICGTCGASFDCYSQLLIHDRVHMKAGSSSTVWKCKSKNTVTKNNHTSSNHGTSRQNRKDFPSERPKKCEECGRILSTKQIWRDHVMQVHRKEHKFNCPFCDFGCPSRSKLEKHMLIHSDHSDVRRFKCHLCSMAFKQKNGLNGHLKRHK